MQEAGTDAWLPERPGTGTTPHLYPPLTRAIWTRPVASAGAWGGVGGGAAWARDEGMKAGGNHLPLGSEEILISHCSRKVS